MKIDNYYDVIIIDSDFNDVHRDDVEVIKYNNSKSNGSYESHGEKILNILYSYNIKRILCIDIDIDILDEENLIGILEMIYQLYPCKVINLCIGIPFIENIENFNIVIEKLLSKSIFLVSAFDNGGLVSYPAIFKNVVGVDIEDELYSLNKFKTVLNSNINMVFSNRYQFVNGIKIAGTSFVVPIAVSIIVTEFWGINKSFEELLLFLEERAFERIETDDYNYRQLDKVIYTDLKAILCPLNKETRNVLLHSEMDIIGVFDFIYNGYVGKKVSEVLNGYSKFNELIVKDIKSIKNHLFDILILGHINEVVKIYGKKEIYDIIQFCLDKKKYVYSFDKIIDFQNSSFFYCPNISFNNKISKNLGKLHYIHKPILSVMGTSSIQGKFYLQMNLKKNIESNGFKVKSFITEPGAELFGIDASLPMGYNSNHKISYKTCSYINDQLYYISKDADLLLCGAQSFSVHSTSYHLRNFSIESIEFLLGTNPDAVILVVNYNDDFEYIQRSINFIESFSEAEVICIVIFSMNKADSKQFDKFNKIDYLEINNIRNKIDTTLKKRAFIYDEIGEISNHVTEYFK